MANLTKIVIVGAGFAGLQTVLGLARKFKYDESVALTLVDRNDYHLFSPNLYEVACLEEEFVSVRQLKKSVVLPIKEILSGFKVDFIKGELQAVSPRLKKITIGVRELEYDYLVLAMGSVPDYFQIEGASQHGLPLRSLVDALRIRNATEFAVQLHRLDIKKKVLKFVIAGGGYTAVEMAGELGKLLNIVAWKNNYPRERLEIVVIEAGGKLLAGFSERLSRDALLRLNELKVQVKFYSRIVNVSRHLIELANGEKMEYCVLIWAAGVKAAPSPQGLDLPQKEKGRIEVNEFLQIKGLDNIFAVGDLPYITDAQQKLIPATAQNAVYQGKYLAYALPQILKNRRPVSFRPRSHGFIVNVGKHWAILSIDHWYLKGFLAYFIDLLAHFDYYRSLIGLKKAFRYISREVNLQRGID